MKCGKVFQEKASGARTDRMQLMRLLKALRPGDLVIVIRLDRLARSTRDLLNVHATITESKAVFRSLSDAWADTTTAHGRLLLTVLGGAGFERELIRQRTGEGRARAKVRGIRFGRKPKLTAHQRQEAIARRAAGEPLTEIGEATTSATVRSVGFNRIAARHIRHARGVLLPRRGRHSAYPGRPSVA
ncbi:MAG: recombinase family protein [Alphaproteobacteria bacterium]